MAYWSSGYIETIKVRMAAPSSRAHVHIEAAAAGHVDVEHQHIASALAERVQHGAQLAVVAGLADDLNVTAVGQGVADARRIRPWSSHSTTRITRRPPTASNRSVDKGWSGSGRCHPGHRWRSIHPHGGRTLVQARTRERALPWPGLQRSGPCRCLESPASARRESRLRSISIRVAPACLETLVSASCAVR